MKTFNSNTTAELAKEIAATFHLIQFGFETTIRYTDCDRPIYDDSSNVFTPRSMRIGNHQYSSMMSVDSLEVEIDNSDLEVSAIILNEEVRNKTASIFFCAIGSDYRPIAIEDHFIGFVSNWKLLESKVTFEIANLFILWNKKPLRKAQASCPWEFKGTECTYSGSEGWCDKTLARCIQLDNRDNFGGFPWLKSTMETKLIWGDY